MPKKNLMMIAVEEHPQLTFEEICRAVGVSPDFVQEAISFGIIEPHEFSTQQWRFNSKEIRRLRIALHLHQDLEVNLAGAALVLDLLQRMEEMHVQLDILKKHFSSRDL